MLTSNTDVDATLTVWGVAESAVTIVATSIPALRSLLLEFRGKKKHTVSTDAWTHKKTRTGQSTVTVTADRTLFDRGGAGESSQRLNDAGDGYATFAQDDGKIVQTREVAIEYEQRPPGSDSGEFELVPV